MNIDLIQGDITTLQVDCIVNAANSSLLGGGGVDGAIHSAAGPGLLQACEKLGGASTGEAKITPGFNLPAKYIIHAVGPVWNGGNSNEKELLKNAYLNAMLVADENSCISIAFPNISTGIYGFPKKLAAVIAVNTVNDYSETTSTLESIIFVCFDLDNYMIYKNLL